MTTSRLALLKPASGNVDRVIRTSLLVFAGLWAGCGAPETKDSGDDGTGLETRDVSVDVNVQRRKAIPEIVARVLAGGPRLSRTDVESKIGPPDHVDLSSSKEHPDRVLQSYVVYYLRL